MRDNNLRSILVGSAVFAQLTVVTNTHTHKQTDLINMLNLFCCTFISIPINISPPIPMQFTSGYLLFPHSPSTQRSYVKLMTGELTIPHEVQNSKFRTLLPASSKHLPTVFFFRQPSSMVLQCGRYVVQY